MNIKRLGIGAVVGAATLYLLGMLFWDFLFMEFFAANAGSAIGVWRETPILWSHLLGALLYAALLTLALESRSGSKSLVEGLKVGAIVGLLVWGTADFTFYGLTIIHTLTGAVTDVVLEGVRAAIAGGVVAVVLGKVGD